MSRARKLLADQRGAIMVMGVFMAALLVGFIYYAIGTADAILARERMQDASDSAAFSAAVVHARGMNIIALINMVMAAVLAVLVALKIVETLIIIAIAIAAALSWCCGTAALIPPLNQARTMVSNIYNQVKPIVFNILRAGNKASTAVAKAVPIAAQAKVLDTVMATYKPPAQFGFAWPIYQELPVQDGCFKDLCEKAGEYAGQLVALPLAIIPGGSFIGDKLGGMIGKLARTFPGYFCGSSGSGACASEQPEAPMASYETDVYYPETENARKCRELQDAAACDAVAQEEADVCLATDPSSGKCTERVDEPDADGNCTNAQCSLRATEAATQCKPRSGLTGYEYQQCQVTVVNKITAWNEEGPVSTPVSETVTCQLKGPGGPPPCGQGDWTAWGANLPQYLCRTPEINEAAMTPVTHPVGTEYDSYYETVPKVFACMEKKTIDVEMTDSLDMGGSSGDDMAPKVMKPDDKYRLGESGLQLKVVVIGDPTGAFKRGEEGVKVATWGKDDDDIYATIRELSRLSLAQAEYYYDCSGGDCDVDEFLWHMYWRARLRRFRISADDGSAQDACAGQDTDCGSGGFLDSMAGVVGDLIIH